jgi:uncharacterized protein (UPF0548 family)
MRISISKPSPTTIEAALAEARTQSLTYAPVRGTLSTEKKQGYDNDAQRVAVGQGMADFLKAKAALQRWAHFPTAWTAILPADTPIVQDEVLTMYFRLFGLWWQNTCKIIYVVDKPTRFAFAYGTLPGHIECGEEVFGVEMDEDGVVWYDLRAFSKPKVWYVRLGYPLARLLQEKFRQDSALSVRRSVGGVSPTPRSPNAWALHLLGFIIAAVLLWPGSFMGHDYGKIPLLFAFFVMSPLVLAVGSAYFAPSKWPSSSEVLLTFPAAVLAAVSLGMEQGLWAVLLGTPWLLGCLWVGWQGRRSPLAAAAGCLFLCVGGAWFWADRAGLQPMGFGDDIVRLTALHFHYAGFALPVLAAILEQIHRDKVTRVAALGTVLGVPLTAVGITATQYHWGPVPETVAAVVMSLSGMLTGVGLLRIAVSSRNMIFGIAGTTLLFTMTLSLTYGLRVYLPSLAIDLDRMRAIHGSLNGLVALPLAFLGLWYWRNKFFNKL